MPTAEENQETIKRLTDKGYVLSPVLQRFNGRETTEREKRFSSEAKCISCGISLEITVRKRKKTLSWKNECKDCNRCREHTHTATVNQRYLGTQEISSSYKRIMGYKPEDVK